jgi:hypothetical protein
MKSFLSLVALSAFYGLGTLASVVAYAQVPEQAQASALAVPGEEAQKAAVGALVVVQCKQAVAVVLIDSAGALHPLHGASLTATQLTTLLEQIPADNVTEIEVTCHSSTSI